MIQNAGPPRPNEAQRGARGGWQSAAEPGPAAIYTGVTSTETVIVLVFASVKITPLSGEMSA